jgi:uncharacterized membrane protein
MWALIVAFAEPWGRLWGTGQDARCYYQATLADPYLHSSWNDPIAYVYSPAFLQLVTPFTSLPWQAFMAVWTAMLIGAAAFLTGPRLLAAGLLFPFTAMEVAGGNISLLLAVAIVLGFRWPATWSLVLLTKITPGIGAFTVFLGLVPEGHVFWPLAVVKVTAAAILVLAIATGRRAWRVPRRIAVGVVGVGIADMAGNGLFLLAAQAGQLAIASVLSSLYPVTTVILAAVVLREPISRSHSFGIAVAIVAIVLIGTGAVGA